MSYQARALRRRVEESRIGQRQEGAKYHFRWSLTSVQFHKDSQMNYSGRACPALEKGMLLCHPAPKASYWLRISRAGHWEKNSQNFLAKPFWPRPIFLGKAADASRSWGVLMLVGKRDPRKSGWYNITSFCHVDVPLLHQNLGPTSQGDPLGQNTHSSMPPHLSFIPIFIFPPVPKISFCWNILWLHTTKDHNILHFQVTVCLIAVKTWLQTNFFLQRART